MRDKTVEAYNVFTAPHLKQPTQQCSVCRSQVLSAYDTSKSFSEGGLVPERGDTAVNSAARFFANVAYIRYCG